MLPRASLAAPLCIISAIVTVGLGPYVGPMGLFLSNGAYGVR